MPIKTLTEIRNSVHVLKAQGRSLREISRLLKLSRNTVRRILREHQREAAPSSPCDAQTLAALEDAFTRARGNVVRVQQLLAGDNDLHISYSTLTRLEKLILKQVIGDFFTLGEADDDDA